MKLTTLYPAYFPSLLWWQKAAAADIVVLLDDQPTPRLAHLNRCWIKSAAGPRLLVVPVANSRPAPPILNRLEVDPEKNWSRRHQASLKSNYSHAPYFEYFFPYLREFLTRPYKKIVSLFMQSVELIMALLRWKRPFQYHSRYNTSGRKEERVTCLLQQTGCDTYVIETGHETYFDDEFLTERGYTVQNIVANRNRYQQQFGAFIPGLSILDVLLNEGPFALHLIQGKALYQAFSGQEG